MHAAIELAIFWGFAFLTLCLAVVLYNIFGNLVESDMELLSLGKEAALAGIASFIEAAGVWLIVLFVPAMSRGLALRAEIVPILAVALLYRIAHLEDSSIYDVGLILAFQLAIAFFIAALLTGHFLAAIGVVVVVGIVLAAIAGLAKNF
jgi:hypothetical protein